MVKRKRRSFTPEFKMECAQLVVDQGYNCAEVARAMDVSSTALRLWVKQLTAERGGDTPRGKAMTTEQRRIQELEKRLKRVEMEKEILKKATALLMSDSLNNLR